MIKAFAIRREKKEVNEQKYKSTTLSKKAYLLSFQYKYYESRKKPRLRQTKSN